MTATDVTSVKLFELCATISPMQEWITKPGALCVRDALTQAADFLSGTGSHPKRDAELLLRSILGQSRAWLLAHPEAEITPEQAARYGELLRRRGLHEPVQYILGGQEFYGLQLRVTPAVLIPRPETEHLVEAVLARLPRDRDLRIADVGVGSGAVALALAAHLPLAHVDTFDISAGALAVAEENARNLGLTGRVRCFESDLLAAAPAVHYDCIASNPPYIAEGEQLEEQVLNWEPHAALFAGADGLEIYRQLVPQAAAHLVSGGLLALECGAGQAAAVSALLTCAGGWSAPVVTPDLQGLARVVCSFRTLSN